jgi:uncharacterized membrane protein
MTDKVTLARALHVGAVVLWIGGVAFVATVLLPAIRRFKKPQERLAFFESVERRFAWQARATTLIVGVTGLYMTADLHLWDRFKSAGYWWMHGMVAVWAVFTLMLFVAEPLFLHRWFNAQAARDPDGTFVLIERLHQFLIVASLIVVLGAVIGSHG